MKAILIKFLRGVSGILVFKFFLISMMFLVYSCSPEDENPESIRQESLKRFENFLTKEAKILTNDGINHSLFDMRSEANLSEINSIPVERAAEFLNTLVYESLQVLKAFDFNDEEIVEEFGGLDSPLIFATAGAILVAKKEESLKTAYKERHLEYSLFNKAMAEQTIFRSYGPVIDCALHALGIGGLGQIIATGIERAGARTILKTVAKVAGRSLGILGWTWAAIDYIDCLDRNNVL